MAVNDLQSWADNLETVRLPDIEGDIDTLQSTQTATTTLLNQKIQEFGDRIDANKVSAQSAKDDAAAADARAISADVRVYDAELNSKAYTDAKIQEIRDLVDQRILGVNTHLDGDYSQAIQQTVQNLLDQHTSDISAIASQVAISRDDALTALSQSNALVNELLDQEIPQLRQQIIDSLGPLDAGPRLADQVDTLNDDMTSQIEEIDRIGTDLNTNIPVIRGSRRAQKDLANRMLALRAKHATERKRMADAGIYTDKETGQVRIEALHRIDEVLNQLEINLNAAKAEIELRVTSGELSEELTQLVLDPTRIPDLNLVKGQISDIQVILNGLDGRFAAQSITATVEEDTAKLAQAILDINSLEEQINLRVTTTEFSDLEERTSQAEIQLNSMDAPSITQSVTNSRIGRRKLKKLSGLSLEDALKKRKVKDDLRKDLSYARQDMVARLDDNAASTAELSQELGAFKEDTGALFRTEAKARADGEKALAERIESAEADVGNASAAIDEINRVEADSKSGNARALHQLQQRVEGPEGIAEALTSVESRVETTEQGLEAASRERQTFRAGLGRPARRMATQGLRALLEGTNARRAARRGLSEAKGDFYARVVDAVKAEAGKREELTSALNNSIAKVDREIKTVATDQQAAAEAFTLLLADVEEATAAILEKTEVSADSENAFAKAVSDMVADVEGTKGAITDINDISADSNSAAARKIHALDVEVGKNSAAIIQLNTVTADSTSALVLDYLNLKGAVNDEETGLAKAWGDIEAIKGMEIGEDTVLGQLGVRMQAQVGGDGQNLVPDAQISTELLWNLGSHWTLVENSAQGEFLSKGHLRYTHIGGTGWSNNADTYVFRVEPEKVYRCALQTQGKGSQHQVRGRIQWLTGEEDHISFSTITNTTVVGQDVELFEKELTSPPEAKRAILRIDMEREFTTGDVWVGGPTIQRLGEELIKTRGYVDDVVNLNLDENSALFTKLTGVTTEVFGEDGESGLKLSTHLLQESMDGVKGGFSLLTNNNGHISGLASTSDLADGVSATTDLLFAADKIFFTGEVYAVGTVNVTKGSKTVNGSGTSWNANVSPGDWFTGPDKRTYKIAARTNNTLTLERTYKGQTDTNETYSIASGFPLLTIYTEDVVVDGVTIPKGVYIDQARIRKGNVFDLSVGNKIESSNYEEDAKGNPTKGFHIPKNGSPKFANPIISRPLVLASGSFQHSGTIYNNARWVFVNTGVRIGKRDVWEAQKVALTAVAHIDGGVAGQPGLDPNNAFWACKAHVLSGARWYGYPHNQPAVSYRRDPGWPDNPKYVDPDWASGTDQRLFLEIFFESTGGVYLENPIIEWKVFQVT